VRLRSIYRSIKFSQEAETKHPSSINNLICISVLDAVIRQTLRRIPFSTRHMCSHDLTVLTINGQYPH
jgi:hypothetical protein